MSTETTFCICVTALTAAAMFITHSVEPMWALLLLAMVVL